MLKVEVGGVAPCAVEEVEAVRAVTSDNKILRILQDALRQGMPKGEPGSMETKFVDLEHLDHAIGEVVMMPRASEEGAILLETVRLIRQLRAAQKANEWDRVLNIVTAARERVAEIDKLAEPELTTAWLDVHTRKLVEVVHAALKEGAASGNVGNFDLSVMDTELLKQTLALEGRPGSGTQIGSGLISVVRHVLAMRQAWLQEDWEQMVRSIKNRINLYRVIFSSCCAGHFDQNFAT